MTNSANREDFNAIKHPDFANDLDLLCEDVGRGFCPVIARKILSELIQKHDVSDLLEKFAAAELEYKIFEVSRARWRKQGPNPDLLLDSSIHTEFENRVRIRFGLSQP